MSRKTVYFGLVVLLILSAAIVLIGGLGGDQKATAGVGILPVRDGSPQQGKTAPAAVNAKAHALISDFGRVPVFFVPNQGQTDDPVSFYVQGTEKTVYFSPDGLTIAFRDPQRSEEAGRYAVKLDFLGARKDVKPEGLEKTGATVSYFKGKPDEWKAGLPAYSRIIYRELWPGIDLAYKGELDQLKYEFIVRPGADPSAVKLAYRGAESVALTPAGRLSVVTPAGGFEDDIPLAYQETEGQRVKIPVVYSIAPPAIVEAEGQIHVYGFELDEYDQDRTLVIDPAVFVYCGYIGGVSMDSCKAIAVDGSGNVYVTGITDSDETSFPVTVGPDLTKSDGANSYVAKVNASGTGLVYCGYIGSVSNGDMCNIAVDDSGCAYITQGTHSTEADFPVTVGPDLTHNGAMDAFIAKVNPSGTSLVYCGYIGGASDDAAMGVAVDGAGNAYIMGFTQSTEGSFPVTVGPDLTSNGLLDAFVAKVNPAGTALDYCGFIGGSADDAGTGIAVDDSGNAYVVGMPGSAQGFPLTAGPDLTFNGGMEIFVAKVKASGIGLDYCGVIGGSGDEAWPIVAVDGSGNAYVGGTTYSSQASFPVKVGPDLTYNGDLDVFVAKVNSSGTGFVYCGYVGGSGWDNDTAGIAVDSAGNAYVTGHTNSDESTFPVVDGPDLTYAGGNDAFIAKINSLGTGLDYCGYIGGTAEEIGYDVAVDSSGNAYISGVTVSDQSTFPVVEGPGLVYSGGYDAFVAKIGPPVPGPPITSLLPDSADAGDPGFLLSVVGSDFVNGAVVRWDSSERTTTYVSSSELQAQIAAADLAAGKTVQVTVRNPDGGISNALPFTIDNPLPALTSVSPTQVTGGGAAFALTVHGTNFVPNSVVHWGGSGRTTTYVGATELQAAILATDLAAGGEVQVTVSNPAPSGGVSGALAVQVSGFTLSASPTSVTVAAGQSATYTITLAPQNGSFDAAVTFNCTGLPGKCTATFSPASATPGADSVTTTLTLATKASAATEASLAGMIGFGPPAWGLLGLVLTLLLATVGRGRFLSRHSRSWLAVAAMVCLVILIGSCSSGGDGDNPPAYTGTPKGTHTISVQGTSGTMTVPAAITLVVN